MGLEFIHEVGVEVGELNFRNLMTGLEFILGVGELNFRILILVFIDMCWDLKSPLGCLQNLSFLLIDWIVIILIINFNFNTALIAVTKGILYVDCFKSVYLYG